MTEYYERYVISELPPKSILDQNTGDTIPIEDEGVFETICDLLNRQNIIMESRNETIKFHVDGYNKLKQTLEDLRTYSNDEIEEAEHINTIYKEQGFKGVIDYAKDKLQNYGVVREVENGLWVMVTGGWSDNEFWLHCLNNPVSVFGMKHYRGYLRGGAFYYTEKLRGDVEIVLKGDVE